MVVMPVCMLGNLFSNAVVCRGKDGSSLKGVLLCRFNDTLSYDIILKKCTLCILGN